MSWNVQNVVPFLISKSFPRLKLSIEQFRINLNWKTLNGARTFCHSRHCDKVLTDYKQLTFKK